MLSLSTIWLVIKALAGMIAIVFLAGILILSIQGFVEAVFKDNTQK